MCEQSETDPYQDVFITELKNFQTQDDFFIRKLILSGFQKKMIELLYCTRPESEGFTPEQVMMEVDDLYNIEKSEHRGLDIVTYSGMKQCYFIAEADEALSDLKDFIECALLIDETQKIPEDIYVLYFISIIYRLGGVINYLSHQSMTSSVHVLNNKVSSFLHDLSNGGGARWLGFIDKCSRELADFKKEPSYYDLNLSSVSLKNKGANDI